MRNVIAAVMGIVIAFALVSVTDAVAGTLFRLPDGTSLMGVPDFLNQSVADSSTFAPMPRS